MGGGKDKPDGSDTSDKGFLSNIAHGFAGHPPGYHAGYPYPPPPGQYPPQGYPPAPGPYPPHGYPPPWHAPYGYPPSGYAPAGGYPLSGYPGASPSGRPYYGIHHISIGDYFS